MSGRIFKQVFFVFENINCFPILVASAEVLDFDKQVFSEIKNKNVMGNYFFSSFFPRSSLSFFSFSLAFYLEKKSNLSVFPECSPIREKFPVLPIVIELFKWISSAFKVPCGDHNDDTPLLIQNYSYFFKKDRLFNSSSEFLGLIYQIWIPNESKISILKWMFLWADPCSRVLSILN